MKCAVRILPGIPGIVTDKDAYLLTAAGSSCLVRHASHLSVLSDAWISTHLTVVLQLILVSSLCTSLSRLRPIMIHSEQSNRDIRSIDGIYSRHLNSSNSSEHLSRFHWIVPEALSPISSRPRAGMAADDLPIALFRET